MTTARDVIAEEIADWLTAEERATRKHVFAADDVLAALLSADESVRLELAGMLNPPKPAKAWTEEMGDVLWWEFPVHEPPYIGSPITCGYPVQVTVETANAEPQIVCAYTGGWPDRHTHFTLIPLPAPPSEVKP